MDTLISILGLDETNLSIGQMSFRALLIYLVALALVRIGETRFLGRFTPMDAIVGFMLGSVLSRAITGSSPLIPTLAASVVLVGMHWLLAAISFRSGEFGNFVKGTPRLLVQNGVIQWDAMRRSHISRMDLESAMRTQARTTQLCEVREARLERSGEISIVLRD